MTDNHPGQHAGDLATLLQAEELPCGHDVDEILEQVADGHGDQLNEHQRSCVHCRAAIS